MLSLIASFFRAIAAVFGFQAARLQAKNAPEVKQAKVAQQETDEVSKVESAVANKNVDEIRKYLAE